MEAVGDMIRWQEPSLWLCFGAMALAPLGWNVAARLEYKTKWLSRLCGGPYQGCYLLGTCIFLFGLFRDWTYGVAVDSQPKYEAISGAPGAALLALALWVVGGTLVFTSFWRLGFTGTYLGDYFGILFDERITSFPFSVLNDPMYVGATINFVAASIWYGSPAGFLISLWVYIVYKAALHFESPWTAFIYEEREKERKRAKKSL